MKAAFKRGDTNEVIQIMNTSFAGVNYSLSDLFKDQQRKILDRLLENTREEISASFTHIYEHNYAIMKWFATWVRPCLRIWQVPPPLF